MRAQLGRRRAAGRRSPAARRRGRAARGLQSSPFAASWRFGSHSSARRRESWSRRRPSSRPGCRRPTPAATPCGPRPPPSPPRSRAATAGSRSWSPSSPARRCRRPRCERRRGHAVADRACESDGARASRPRTVSRGSKPMWLAAEQACGRRSGRWTRTPRRSVSADPDRPLERAEVSHAHGVGRAERRERVAAEVTDEPTTAPAPTSTSWVSQMNETQPQANGAATGPVERTQEPNGDGFSEVFAAAFGNENEPSNRSASRRASETADGESPVPARREPARGAERPTTDTAMCGRSRPTSRTHRTQPQRPACASASGHRPRHSTTSRRPQRLRHSPLHRWRRPWTSPTQPRKSPRQPRSERTDAEPRTRLDIGRGRSLGAACSAGARRRRSDEAEHGRRRASLVLTLGHRRPSWRIMEACADSSSRRSGRRRIASSSLPVDAGALGHDAGARLPRAPSPPCLPRFGPAHDRVVLACGLPGGVWTISDSSA